MEIFAHVVGEHQTDNPIQLTAHLIISWLVILATPMIIGLIGAYMLSKSKRNTARQEKRDE